MDRLSRRMFYVLPKTALARKAQVFRLGAVGAKPI